MANILIFAYSKISMNKLKYALIERERKYLLPSLGDIVNYLHYKQITDHYISGTYLRLRKMTGNEKSVYKLTRKIPANSPDSFFITTIYLNENEYELFNKHPAIIVEKTRFLKEANGFKIGIDSYTKGNDKLLLAEVEFDSDEDMSQFIMPLEYTKEVTDNPAFNGYELAKRFIMVI
jgi:CYTH domain-containing protein